METRLLRNIRHKLRLCLLLISLIVTWSIHDNAKNVRFGRRTVNAKSRAFQEKGARMYKLCVPTENVSFLIIYKNVYFIYMILCNSILSSVAVTAVWDTCFKAGT